MENKKIVELIKENSYLLPKEYKFNIFEESGVIFNICLNDENFIKHIGCWIQRGKIITGFNIFLTIIEVERILQPLLMKHNLIGDISKEYQYTISYSSIEPDLFQQNLNPSYPKTINKEEDVIDLLNDLSDYTKNVAEHFFEKWSDLRVLDKFLDTVPQMEVSKYLGGYGVFSKMLIYKLCNNPKYEEYFNLMYSFSINRYKENPNGDEAIKQKHDFMIDFKEVLDKIEPRYNV